LTESQTRFSNALLAAGQRLALRVEYDGGPFAGWQAQPQLSGVITVQQELERALASVCAAPLRVHCAGRTDTGVHAVAQWVHFDLPAARGLKACVVGTNAQLRPSVRVADARVVDADFHARHSATARRYDYLIANTPTAPALLVGRALWCRDPLDAASMHRALQPLLGERDFSAFRAAACQSRTPMRFLAGASVTRRGDYVQVRLVANAFLHHMVRNIVGSLLEVGRGARDEQWLERLLAGRDRTVAAATAPPHGLYLTGVEYPERIAIDEVALPPFLAP
jgi:tRNA pseudouridine38-40 synthase